MTQKDFWRNSVVAVMGGGAWGTLLANEVSKHCREVRVWMRDENSVRSINVERANAHYLPDLQLNEKIHAFHSVERVFEGGVQAVIWALPSSVCRENARKMARYFRGDEMILHATKGVEPETMKRVSEILTEEIPCRRVGVISGPNLAAEVARGDPAATVVASQFIEVCEVGQNLLNSERLRVYRESDVIGVEWAGALKNIYAIAAGAVDAMKMGWNTRAMLITRGLTEMVRFGEVMGAQANTFMGLAGIGDLLATCSSPLSRNYRVGFRLAQGEKISAVLEELGATAEGVQTTRSVWEFASLHRISMPITEGVYRLLNHSESPQEILRQLMVRPLG